MLLWISAVPPIALKVRLSFAPMYTSQPLPHSYEYQETHEDHDKPHTLKTNLNIQNVFSINNNANTSQLTLNMYIQS